MLPQTYNFQGSQIEILEGTDLGVDFLECRNMSISNLHSEKTNYSPEWLYKFLHLISNI